jgi:hypothetical protein
MPRAARLASSSTTSSGGRARQRLPETDLSQKVQRKGQPREVIIVAKPGRVAMR